MTQSTATQRGGEQAIRPFPVASVPEAELTDLRKRINETRWPERETVTDATQGVQLATTQALARLSTAAKRFLGGSDINRIGPPCSIRVPA